MGQPTTHDLHTVTYRCPRPYRRSFTHRGRRNTLAAVLLSVATTLVAAPTADASGTRTSDDSLVGTQQTLFRSGTGGYGCFRIPTLIRTKAGTLLAFAEGRHSPSCADRGPIDLVLRRSTNDGRTWGPISTVLAGSPTDPEAVHPRQRHPRRRRDHRRRLPRLHRRTRHPRHPPALRPEEHRRRPHLRRPTRPAPAQRQDQRLVRHRPRTRHPAPDRPPSRPPRRQRLRKPRRHPGRQRRLPHRRHRSRHRQIPAGPRLPGPRRSRRPPLQPHARPRLRRRHLLPLLQPPGHPHHTPTRPALGLRPQLRRPTAVDPRHPQGQPDHRLDPGLRHPGQPHPPGPGRLRGLRRRHLAPPHPGPLRQPGPPRRRRRHRHRHRPDRHPCRTPRRRRRRHPPRRQTRRHRRRHLHRRPRRVPPLPHRPHRRPAHRTAHRQHHRLWAYGSTTGQPSLWIRARPQKDELYAWAETDQGKVNFSLPDPDTARTAFGDDQWHLLTATRAGTTLTVSVDTTHTQHADGLTGSFTAGRTTVPGLRLGSRPGATEILTGTLDDFRLYDRALTDTELAKIAAPASGTGAYPADSRIWWSMENGTTQSHDVKRPTTGPATPDASAHCNHAYVRGNPTLTATSGAFGGGIDLDGTDDSVDLPYTASKALGAGDFTLGTWLRYDATTATGTPVLAWAYGQGATERQLWLRAEPGSQRLAALMQTENAATTAYAPDTAFRTGAEWHHVVLQRQGTRLTLSVDGTTGTPGTVPTGSLTYGDAFDVTGMHLGVRPDGAASTRLRGSLDEFRLIRRALTAAELTALRETNTDPADRSTVVRLSFEKITAQGYARM